MRVGDHPLQQEQMIQIHLVQSDRLLMQALVQLMEQELVQEQVLKVQVQAEQELVPVEQEPDLIQLQQHQVAIAQLLVQVADLIPLQQQPQVALQLLELELVQDLEQIQHQHLQVLPATLQQPGNFYPFNTINAIELKRSMAFFYVDYSVSY